jgi:hypothetical protein
MRLSRSAPRRSALCAALWLAACDPAPAPDAGSPDAAAGPQDAGAASDAPGSDALASPDAAAVPDAPSPSLVPAIFRTPDVNAVCAPTPAAACTPGDLAWLAGEYGTSYRRAEPARVAAAPHAYRLVALAEREGPSNLDVFVVDEAGAPIADLPVAFWYSSAPDASRADEWYPQRVTTRTGVDGRVGFALGGGAYLAACGSGGPHAVWVTEPGAAPDTTIPSDVADGLGMLGGTNHRHLDLLFQRVPRGATAADSVRCPLGT